MAGSGDRFKIKTVKAREILDSRGNPTVEVDVFTGAGMARAAVPSGASTGTHEALELRDGGKRYGGKGVLKAAGNVNKLIARHVHGRDVRLQGELDEALIELDGTENKEKLGANAILGVSMAACRAAAMGKGVPLFAHIAEISGSRKMVMPVPSMNVINGGAHAGSSLAVQEFMIQPFADTFAEALRMGAETYHVLKGIVKEKHGKSAINVGDEGGFAPAIESTEEAISLIMKAIEQAGCHGKMMLALDSAASGFYKDGTYHIDGRKLSTGAMVDFYAGLSKTYPIISFEDPFEEEDWRGFAQLTKRIGQKVTIIGDDLLVTNVKRMEKAIEMEACNGLLLKVNQIGTVSEAIEAAKYAMKSGWKVMVSHRSGETEDSFIADLVVGLGTGLLKTGAPCRSERNCKYNQLLRIEEELLSK